MIFHFMLIILPYQIEEDIGSAEEQPISNKFDTYTKNEAVKTAFFYFIFWYVLWLKKPTYKFDFYNTSTTSKSFFCFLNLIHDEHLSYLLGVQKMILMNLLYLVFYHLSSTGTY